jgi:transposase
VRLTAKTVEIFLKGERIAAHMRASGNHKHTTIPEHMPSSHRRYAGWTTDRIRADARLIGPATAALCELILEQRPHPEQGFRACLGIVRLARTYGAERLEAAAERAIEIGARTYGSVKSILANKLDRRPAQKRAADGTPILIMQRPLRHVFAGRLWINPPVPRSQMNDYGEDRGKDPCCSSRCVADHLL